MTLHTGDDYRASLRDGRAVWIEGERVEDVPSHPAFEPIVDARARIYDLAHDPALRDLLTYADPEAGGRRLVAHKLPRTQADWQAKRAAVEATLDDPLDPCEAIEFLSVATSVAVMRRLSVARVADGIVDAFQRTRGVLPFSFGHDLLGSAFAASAELRTLRRDAVKCVVGAVEHALELAAEGGLRAAARLGREPLELALDGLRQRRHVEAGLLEQRLHHAFGLRQQRGQQVSVVDDRVPAPPGDLAGVTKRLLRLEGHAFGSNHEKPRVAAA